MAFLADATLRQSVPEASVQAFGVLAAPGTSPHRLADAIKSTLHDDTLAVHTGAGRGRAEFLDVTVSGSNLVVLAAAIGGNVLLVAVFVLYATTSLSIRHRRREIALLRAIGTTPARSGAWSPPRPLPPACSPEWSAARRVSSSCTGCATASPDTASCRRTSGSPSAPCPSSRRCSSPF